MPLRPGVRLGPYEIVTPLGAGGMGEVYRALDTRLGRTVAIKVLPDTLKFDLEFRDRLEREARAIAALNHPHICTLHDVGEQDGIDFLVMEYLDGETLADRLTRGSLPVDEFLRVAIQVTTALQAAHEQHVIHRDIKPANIFITGRGTAKVVDFGLAKQAKVASGDSLALTRAATSVFAGTIEYMSPEQARGQNLDARSDLFSLGIVLHEMATGLNPFRGADFVETLHHIVHRNPARIAATGRGAWTSIDRIVRKCLEKQPERRYESAAALLDDLLGVEGAHRTSGSSSVRLPAPLSWVPRGSRWRRSAVAVALVAIVAVAGMWWARRGSDRVVDTPGPSGAEPHPIKVRRSVAVLGLQNLSGRQDEAWLSTALAEMLSAELNRGETLRVIAGQNIARVKRELGLEGGTTLDGDTLKKVRSLVGVDLVVLGSYLLLPSSEQLTVVLNVQDSVAAETVSSATQTGTRDAMLALVSALATELRQDLGVSTAGSNADDSRSQLSSNSEALRLYVDGLEKLRAQEFVQARDVLTQAIAADPGNALIHATMAEVWSSLGFDQRAEQEAVRAVERAATLSREDRLSVESRSYEMAKRWDKAIESYRTLYGFFPDNIEYGLGLARVLTKAGRPAEALSTIATLRQLPGPAGRDVRFDLAEAEAAHETSEYERELAAGKAAADKGVELGARLLVAQGRLAQAQAHLRLGRPTQAVPLLESSRQLFIASGDRSGEARTLNRIANVAYEQGDYERAKLLFIQTEKVLRGIGNLSDLTNALNNIADTLMMQDELSAAKPLFAQALELTRERDDPLAEGFLRLNLADLALRQGNVAEARALGTQGLQMARETNHLYGVYMGLLTLGDLALATGDLASAAKHFDEGLALAQRAGDLRFKAYLLAARGNLALAEGRAEDARKQHTEALQIRARLGSHTELAESRLALARVGLVDGGVTSGRDVRPAIATFEERRLAAAECYAWAVHAAASLAADQTKEAADAAGRAEQLLPRVQTLSRRLWVGIQISRVNAASGDRPRAISSLRAALAQARSRGFTLLQREAERALAAVVAMPAAAHRALAPPAADPRASGRQAAALPGEAPRAAVLRVGAHPVVDPQGAALPGVMPLLPTRLASDRSPRSRSRRLR